MEVEDLDNISDKLSDDEVEILEEPDDIDEKLKFSHKDPRYLNEAKKIKRPIITNSPNRHGQTIYFNNILSGKTSLPKRNDFITKIDFNSVEWVKFNTISSYENNTKQNEIDRYTLHLVGILENGEKAVVSLQNIKIFFDLKVPSYINTETKEIKQVDRKLFAQRIYNLFNSNNRPAIFTRDYKNSEDKNATVKYVIAKPYHMNLVSRKHFKYFDEPRYYLRMFFYKLADRKAAIEYFRDPKSMKEFTKKEMNDEDGCIERSNVIGYETASDDLSCYYRKVCRDHLEVKLCEWGEFKKYILNEDNRVFKCKQFLVDIDDYKTCKEPISKDKVIECNHDIETYNDKNGSGVPKAVFNDNIRDYNKWIFNDKTCLFMICLNFNYWYSKDCIMNVCIVDKYTAPTENKLTIVCDNEFDVLKCFALVFEAMQPDIFTGFNSGNYDIPFIIQTACTIKQQKDGVFDYSHLRKDMIKNHSDLLCNKSSADSNNAKNTVEETNDLLEFMVKHMNLLSWMYYNKKSAMSFIYKAMQIKIEATQNVDEFIIDLPGFICFDVMNIFRKLYSKSQKYSLNFFLTENKLESKYDLPYHKMFYIYKLASLKKKLNEYGIDISKCTKDKKFYFAKYLHKLSDFFESDVTKDFTPEQLDLIKNIANDNTDNIRIHEKYYKASCEIELHLFDTFTTKQIEVMELNVLEMDYVDELMALVAEYCVVDAVSCHKLLLCRNILQDNRELGILTHCSIFDCVFRAGGMKVRNKIIADGQVDGMVFSNISIGIEGIKEKFSGAYVVDPIQKLYKPNMSLEMFYNSLVTE